MPVLGSDLIVAQAPQASALVLVRRLLAPSGDYLVAADLASIELSVTDLRYPNQRVAGYDAQSLSPADVISALVDDTPWAWDDTGYNFLHVLPADARPNADTTYQVEYKLTTTDDVVFYVRYQIESLKVFAEG